MNIVFIAPQSTEPSLPKEYKDIIDICKKLHHSVDVDYIKSTKHQKDELQKKYKAVVPKIKNCDVVIAEASTLTVDVSRLISIALQSHIPVLVLYREKSPEAFVFESSRLLIIKHYSRSNVEEVLKSHLNKIKKKKLIYRFNLMLSKELGSYVMDKSVEDSVSKADYIRSLIIKDMEQGK